MKIAFPRLSFASFMNPFSRKLRGVAVAQKDRSETRRNRRRRQCGAVAAEELEQRLALAVNVIDYFSNLGGVGEEWLMVNADSRQAATDLANWNQVSDVGSDIYMEVVATPTEDLFVADNASFLDRQEFRAVNSSTDSIYVYSGTPVRRDAFAVANTNDVSANFGVPELFSRGGGNGYQPLPGNGDYPWWQGNTAQLSFVLPAEAVDFTEPFSGSIQLGTGDPTTNVVTFTNDPAGSRAAFLAGTAPAGATNGRTLSLNGIPNTPDAIFVGVSLVGGTNPQVRLTFPFSNWPANVGLAEVPTLTVNTVDVNATVDDPATGQIEGYTPVTTIGDLGSVVTANPTIQIYDPGEHRYVPGSLYGTLDNVYGQASVSLAYQVQDTTTGRLVPLSFDDFETPGVAERDAVGNFGEFTYYDDSGAASTVSLEVTGILDSIDGEVDLVVTLAGDGIPRPYSPVISQAKLSVIDIGDDNGNDPMLPQTASLQQVIAAGGTTGTKNDTSANDFTLFPGHNLTTGLTVELANFDSTISIESPVVATAAASDFISLAASRININAPVRAAEAFRIPTSDQTSNSTNRSAFGTITEQVTVNSALSSPSFDMRLQSQRSVLDGPDGGDLTTVDGSVARGRLVVTQTGSISNLADVLQPPAGPLPSATQLYVEMIDGDIYAEGLVVAAAQSYLIQSPQMIPEGIDDTDGNGATGWSKLTSYPEWTPYTMTTASRLTGVDVGEIQATTLAITLANDTLVFPPANPTESFAASTAFSVLDVSTNVTRLRVQASDRENDLLQQPFPYKVSVREASDLIVDAVAASSEAIEIDVNGTLDLLGKLETAGDVRLESADAFTLGAPLTTRFGKIELTAPEVTVRNSVRVLDGIQDERDTDVAITATAGSLNLEDAVSGINRVVLTQQGVGNIQGNARVFADVLEITGTGDVSVRSAATRVAVRAPGSVSVEEADYGVFEVRDAQTVTLVANGFDQVVTEEQVFGDAAVAPLDRAYVSPALYADVYDTQILTVSAPNGSVDVYHYGANPLSIGDLEEIAGGTETAMAAAGSVAIRSTLSEITVYDAPTPTGDAAQVRLATTAGLSFADTSVGGDRGYANKSPGVVPSRLNRVKITRNGKLGVELDNVDVTTLRVGDTILVKDGAATDETNPFAGGTNDDNGISNGLYSILRVHYPVGDTSYVELDLVRAEAADTTDELAQKHYVRVTEGAANAGKVFTADGSVRKDYDADGGGVIGDDADDLDDYAAYEGWGASNQFRFSNVFDNDTDISPVRVRPIMARTGFVTAEAVTTGVLGVGGEGVFNGGVIVFTTASVPASLVNNVNLLLGDLVLVRYGAVDGQGEVPVNSPGLYVVTEATGGATWQLERYQGIDDDGDGVLDEFYTGRVAINQGTLRTAITGEVFEISLDSLGFVPLRYQEVTEYSMDDVVAGTAFDSVKNFRADVGSNNPVAGVTYVVSTENGINTNASWAGSAKATGSFGRMLTLFQQNSAINERTLEQQEQQLTFSSSVSRIELIQELPPIRRPIEITANVPVTVDGTTITRSSDGGVVRSGSVISDVGPVRPTQTATTRRIYRPGQTVTGSVYGLQVLDTADGAKISGLALGGFNNGAAMKVAGAENVLIRNMTIGRDANGERLANRVGIEFDGGAPAHTTVASSTIVNSSEVGISLGTGAAQAHLIGNTIGAFGEGNAKGILIDHGDADPAYVGSAAVPAAATAAAVAGTVVVSPDPVDGDPLVGNYEIEIRVPDSVTARALRVGMVLYDGGNDIAREIEAVSYTPATDTDPGFFSLRIANATAVGAVTGEGALYRVEFDDAGEPVVVVDDPDVTFQLGYLIESVGSVDSQAGKITKGDQQITIPALINPRDVYLGQTVRSSQLGVTSGTVIEALQTAGGVTTATLSNPISQTGTALLLLGAPAANRVVSNSDGIVIRGGNSSVVNTVVTASIYDGIRVEESSLNGTHRLGDALGTIPGFSDVGVLSQSNLLVYGNQLSGIRLTSKAANTSVFATLGALDNGGSGSDAADYATMDAFLADRLRIIGNYLGYNPTTGSAIGNGQTGVANVVVDLDANDDRFADLQRIKFLLLDDTTLNDNGTPADTSDDFYEARLRANVGVGTIDSGLDSQQNRYGEGSGVSLGGGDADRTVTPPRRPVIR